MNKEPTEAEALEDWHLSHPPIEKNEEMTKQESEEKLQGGEICHEK